MLETSGIGAIRVGIVGANPDRGWGSGVHRRVVSMLPGFDLSAVCTTRPESAERAARQFGAAHAFTDGTALAACPDVDLVSICVLAPHHHALAAAAIEAGKHVYCEWPLAIEVAHAETLAEAGRRRGVKAMIGLHLRGAPAMRQAADLIRRGLIGRMTGIHAHIRMFGPTMRTMATRAGGTTLTSIYGGHLLDAIDHFFGPIAEWDARTAIHLPQVDERGEPVTRDAADHLLVLGALDNGALFGLDLGGASLAGLGSHWRIEGSEGVLVLTSSAPDLPAIEALTLSGARTGEALRPIPIAAEWDCAAIPAEPDRYPAYPGTNASRAALASIGNLYDDLASAIRSGGPVTPDFARAVELQRLLARIEPPVASTIRPTMEIQA